MKKLWNILNGNKTIICLGIVTIFEQAIKYELIDNTKFIQFIIGTFTILGGGALVHHAKKGYFSTKKGH